MCPFCESDFKSFLGAHGWHVCCCFVEHDCWSVTVRVCVNSTQLTVWPAGQTEGHLSQIVSPDGVGLLVEEDLTMSEAAQCLHTYPHDFIPACTVVVSCFKILNVFFTVPLGSVLCGVRQCCVATPTLAWSDTSSLIAALAWDTPRWLALLSNAYS